MPTTGTSVRRPVGPLGNTWSWSAFAGENFAMHTGKVTPTADCSLGAHRPLRQNMTLSYVQALTLQRVAKEHCNISGV